MSVRPTVTQVQYSGQGPTVLHLRLRTESAPQAPAPPPSQVDPVERVVEAFESALADWQEALASHVEGVMAQRDAQVLALRGQLGDALDEGRALAGDAARVADRIDRHQAQLTPQLDRVDQVVQQRKNYGR